MKRILLCLFVACLAAAVAAPVASALFELDYNGRRKTGSRSWLAERGAAPPP